MWTPCMACVIPIYGHPTIRYTYIWSADRVRLIRGYWRNIGEGGGTGRSKGVGVGLKVLDSVLTLTLTILITLTLTITLLITLIGLYHPAFAQIAR